MIKLLLGLQSVPMPHDAADALAAAVCHVHSSQGAVADAIRRDSRLRPRSSSVPRTWRAYRP
jgi:hypothetical protein